MIVVPNLTGLTKVEILQQYFDLKVETSGEGKTVAQQSPEPGTQVEAGSVIRIYMK